MDNPGFNFSAGPALLPQPVLETLRQACCNCEGSGYSVFELGHRTKIFRTLLEELLMRVRFLLNVPEEFDILFCPGGATLQFSALPLNLCTQGYRAAYIITGHWSRAAYEEADRISRAYPLWTGDAGSLPRSRLIASRGTDYVFYCDNETIDGKEFRQTPDVELGDAVLVSDMSSNIFTRPVDWSRHGAVFASLQKNIGTAGATLVIVRRDLYGSINLRVPQLLAWRRIAEAGSMLNTPPVVPLYTALLMLRWVQDQGGVNVMSERADRRCATVYSVIDELGGFYTGAPGADVRSRVNIVFRLPSETLEQLFIAEAIQRGLYNLQGHRSRGGIRASLYNAMPQEGAQALASYMTDFYQRHA